MATRKPPPGRGSTPPSKGGRAPISKAPPTGEAKSAQRNSARRAALTASRDLSAKLHGATLVQKADSLATKFRIEMPTLDGVKVHLAAPDPITDADIDAYVGDLIRFAVRKTPRLDGDPIALDDEILVDSTGYCRGVVFSAQSDQWLTMRENPLLPSLFTQLVGLPVGGSTVVNLRLPETYPDADFANSIAAFAIAVKEARRPPTEMDREEILRELGYGATFAEAKEKLRADLEEALTTELIAKAKEGVLAELETRGTDEVPDAAIDAQLEEQWRLSDGPGLAKSGVDFNSQQTALKTYREDAANRQVVRQELWRKAFLEEAAKHFDVKVDQDDLRALMGKAASAMGIDATLVDGALTRMEAMNKNLLDAMRLSRAFDLVIERAEIVFEGQ